MAESHWLAQGTQRLQDRYIDPETGSITDEKQFSLYMRYQTTLGFEAHQKRATQNEEKLHEIKQKPNLGSPKNAFSSPQIYTNPDSEKT